MRERNSGNALQSTTALDEQAAEWLCRLIDGEHDPEEIYANPASRNQAFVNWVTRSPEHVRVFLEIYETRRKLCRIDPQGAIRVQELLAAPSAEIIPLHGETYPGVSDRARAREIAPRYPWLTGVAASAAFVVLGALASFAWRAFGPQVYATPIGGQETVRLDDGSVVTLNTNSRIEIRWSKHARDIKLVRGEALFWVQHDSARPFWVRTGAAVVRAVGTEFVVRRRADSTDVSVVEGVVQVTATEEGNPERVPTSGASPVASGSMAPPRLLRVSAGEQAQVTAGQVAKAAHPSVADALAWRERRLIFHDAPLSEIVGEFNRYNRVQLIVRGRARARRLSGIFDADKPESLAWYASNDDGLAVHQEGNNWLITDRRDK